MGSGQSLRVLGELLGQHLNSHLPIQLGVGGTVDLSHTTFADFLEYLVMANGRTDHRTPPHCNVVAFNAKSVGGEKAIKITLYLGWSWVEWGGVGLARLEFWLQKADFDH